MLRRTMAGPFPCLGLHPKVRDQIVGRFMLALPRDAANAVSSWDRLFIKDSVGLDAELQDAVIRR